MESDWLERARVLRAEAWEAVQASPDYVAFKKFDDLVVNMGGASVVPEGDASAAWKSASMRALDAAAKRIADQKKLSQGDAAEMVLLTKREPLLLTNLLQETIAMGASIGGADPLANFRSALSKDERFFVFKHKGSYLWWLSKEPVPAAWTSDFDELLGGAEVLPRPSAAEDG